MDGSSLPAWILTGFTHTGCSLFANASPGTGVRFKGDIGGPQLGHKTATCCWHSLKKSPYSRREGQGMHQALMALPLLTG